MTVIWFNNDEGEHSVTTLTNGTYSPPVTFDSGFIPANGGSVIHQFNSPGRYIYFDQFDPSVHGVINVGTAIEQGKNFNMHIGGLNTFTIQSKQSQKLCAIDRSENREISSGDIYYVQRNNIKFYIRKGLVQPQL